MLLSTGPAAHAQQVPSPYATRFAVEAPITAGLLGLSATMGVMVPRLHRNDTVFDPANVPPQRFLDSAVGVGVGAVVGLVALHFYKRLHGTGVSLGPVQGANVNGYAYGGVRLTRAL